MLLGSKFQTSLIDFNQNHLISTLGFKFMQLYALSSCKIKFNLRLEQLTLDEIVNAGIFEAVCYF